MRVGDRLDEACLAAGEIGCVQALVDIGIGDVREPGRGAAAQVPPRRAARAKLAEVTVVAGREAAHELAEPLGLAVAIALDAARRISQAEEEIGVEVGRRAQRRARRGLALRAEIARTVAAIGDEGLGHGAEIVAGLRIAVAERLPIAGLDVRDAVGGTPDQHRIAAARLDPGGAGRRSGIGAAGDGGRARESDRQRQRG